MIIIELINSDSMRAERASGPPPNSAAIPLPIAFCDPEFRCRPHTQLIDKCLMYRRFSTWSGRFWETAARFLPGLREERTGSATVGPHHTSSRRGAGGRGLRVGAQAVDEIGKADLPLAPQPFGDDDRLNLRDAFLDVAVDDHVIIFRPMAGLLGR